MSEEKFGARFARELGLPEGWVALEYSTTVEIEGPRGEKGMFVKTYGGAPEEWWKARAAQALKEAKIKN